MDRKGTNILLAGVGGLGVITASNIIGTAAVRVGKKVSSAEVHGIAQRGGSVMGTVRIGDNSVSPLLGDGRADIILGFEPLEVLRNISKASRSTIVITDITPIRVITPTQFIYPKLEGSGIYDLSLLKLVDARKVRKPFPDTRDIKH